MSDLAVAPNASLEIDHVDDNVDQRIVRLVEDGQWTVMCFATVDNLLREILSWQPNLSTASAKTKQRWTGVQNLLVETLKFNKEFLDLLRTTYHQLEATYGKAVVAGEHVKMIDLEKEGLRAVERAQFNIDSVSANVEKLKQLAEAIGHLTKNPFGALKDEVVELLRNSAGEKLVESLHAGLNSAGREIELLQAQLLSLYNDYYHKAQEVVSLEATISFDQLTVESHADELKLLEQQIAALEHQKKVEKSTNAVERAKLEQEAAERKKLIQDTMAANLDHFTKARQALAASKEDAIANLKKVVEQGNQDMAAIGFS